MRLLFILFLIPNTVIAQGRINILGAGDASGNSYTYARHKHVLRSGDAEDGFGIVDIAGALQYRPSQLWSLEVGMQGLGFGNQILDTMYLTRHPENKNDLLNLPSSHFALSKLGLDESYNSYYFTFTRYFPVIGSSSVYISCGLSRNFISKAYASSGVKVYFDSRNNETLTFSYSALQRYFGFIGEAGWNSLLFRGRCTLYLGFRFNTATKKVIVGDYSDVQNNMVINRDHIFTNGTYMGVVLRVGINLVTSKKLSPELTAPHFKMPHITAPDIRIHLPEHRKKQRKSQPSDHQKKQTPVPSPPAVTNKNDEKKVAADNTYVMQLLGRKIESQDTTSVKARTIKIKIWDYDKLDGDIISLNLNGKWILQDYKLQESPYEIKVDMMPGANALILHSVSEGELSPCTAALLISDGISEQKFHLNSDSLKSGELKIIF